MHADSITYHELFKELGIEKMQETNKVTADAKVPDYEEWTIKFPEGDSALPMKEQMFSSGDYWCQLQDLVTHGRERVQSSKTRALLRGFYKLAAVLPGYVVALGNFTVEGTELSRSAGPLRVVDTYSGPLYGVVCAANSPLQGAFGLHSRTFYDGHDVVTERVVEAVQNFTGYKLHKQAVELFEEIMLAPTHSLRFKYSGYGYSEYEGDYQAAALLMKLHGFVVSRFAIPLGFGFRNGEPVVMLGQPRLHKDYAAITEYRCVEMRVGKWLTNYYGSGVDFRESIEDLKAMNVDPTTYLCKTEREWYDAYENGPRSCMTGFSFDCSPVRVYATTSRGLPDNGLRLFIQYTGELFGDDFKVQARAIVNIETKEYVRAYGNAADAILRGHGYTRNTECLEGVLLARIPHPTYTGAVLMPYLDSSQCGVDEEGSDAFVIRDDYEYEAQESEGYIYVGTESARCCCCEGRYSVDDMHETADGEMVCDGCLEEGEFVYVVGREGLHNRWSCTWSDYHDSCVYDADIEYCAVEGVVHDSEELVFAQGRKVLIEHTEEHSVHGLILTEYAADCLGEKYLGNDDEEEVEEAA
ncbi:hypothetical protein A1e_00002 [Klebsiella phage VLCpiA1e]|nr:hypothetical protein A1f_00002 [Klebsiella phage VLCpiA1f]UVX31455.1 hypothetical protein A1e_00002 [Klebsiella phage VLCpiA1e]